MITFQSTSNIILDYLLPGNAEEAHREGFGQGNEKAINAKHSARYKTTIYMEQVETDNQDTVIFRKRKQDPQA